MPESMWRGRYIEAVRDGRWEYVRRVGGVGAVVILAEHDGAVVLVEQYRVPLGRRCIELPAGLVGDENPEAGIDDTAVKELEEETGFTAKRIERIGFFHSSPGMVAEGFTLVRAHGLTRVGVGGGTAGEDIVVHLVPRAEIPAFLDARRAEGCAVDVKLLLLLGLSVLND